MSQLLEQCGYRVHEVTDWMLDDREIAALLEDEPFAIVLPLSLPRYASLRIAELIALRRLRIRLILVSSMRAPDGVLDDLFDCHLPPCADGLIELLQRSSWRHAFERRTVTIDTAIGAVLRSASCFWLGGERHPELFATLVDYHKRITEASRHLTVLFVASDPTDTARLSVLKEQEIIEHELEKRGGCSFSMKHAYSCRTDQLCRRLLEVRPHIVHFSGHGDSLGRLCFEDATRQSRPADKTAIAQVFAASRRYVKCVVLNACFSARQAHLIGQHIEYAIGVRASVSDEAALEMARGFYGALAATSRVADAIPAARANLRLASDGKAALYVAHRVSGFQTRA